jgi:hypothetical protein
MVRRYEKRGWLDPTLYGSDGRTFRSLVELFRIIHANGTKGFLVVAPESSNHRAIVPPTEAFHLTHTLPQVLGEAAPVVLDFRVTAPDEDFRDYIHLTEAGRARMTERLAKALKPYLK